MWGMEKTGPCKSIASLYAVMTDPQINSPKSFITGEFPQFLSSALEQERKSEIKPLETFLVVVIGRLQPMYRLVRWNSPRLRCMSPAEVLTVGSLCRQRGGGDSPGDRSSQLEVDILCVLLIWLS